MLRSEQRRIAEQVRHERIEREVEVADRAQDAADREERFERGHGYSRDELLAWLADRPECPDGPGEFLDRPQVLVDGRPSASRR